MGTSLSGLTPATTFDGLLKTSDNEPLDGTLKAISTGNGTDTMLELSTTALQIGGSTGMYWDNTNKRLGIGTNAPSVPFEVYGGVRFRNALNVNDNIYNSSTGIVNINSLAYFNGITDKVGIGETTPTSSLHIKGSGTTSATTSLLVQNSAGTDLFKVQDDGLVNIIGTNNDYNTVNFEIERSTGESIFRARNRGALEIGSGIDWISLNSSGNGVRLNVSNNEIARIAATGVGIGETTPTARLHVKGSGNDNTTTSLLVQNSDAIDLLKVDDLATITLGRLDAATGGILVRGEQNEIRSNILYYRAKTGGYLGRFDSNGFQVGNGATGAAAKLQIKGSGTTSATTSLLVQNSAGTDILKVQDDGVSNLWLPDSGFKMQRSSACRLEVRGVGAATNIDISPWSGSMSLGAANINKVSVGSSTPLDSKFSVKGSGNDATTTALLVQNSDGVDMLKVTDDSDITLSKLVTIRNSSAGLFARAYADGYGAGGALMWINGSMNLGSSPSTAAKLSVKGSGTTSATTALLVENSTGTDLLKVRDDGAILFQDYYLTSNAFYPISGGNLGQNSVANRHFDDAFIKGYVHITDNTTSSTTYDASAKLQVDSTTQGFLPPRMTTTERDAISTPAAGLMVYNTTTNKAQCYNGSTWNDLF